MILVFGGNGQLGRELVRAAAARNVRLEALTRAEADIADAAAVAAALMSWKPDVVVNAAAYTNVDGAETYYAEAHRGNELGPAILGAVCAKARRVDDPHFDGLCFRRKQRRRLHRERCRSTD